MNIEHAKRRRRKKNVWNKIKSIGFISVFISFTFDTFFRFMKEKKNVHKLIRFLGREIEKDDLI